VNTLYLLVSFLSAFMHKCANHPADFEALTTFSHL